MKINQAKQTLRYWDILFFLAFCIILYFAVFHHIVKLPIIVWDESLFSLRALHMFQTGEYLSDFGQFEGLVNHRNTKLPFTTWFQVLGLKAFGINEFGIRLPIAIIFVLTMFYMIYHFYHRFNSKLSGIVFGMIVVSCIGFVQPHGLRSGDQDTAFACYLLIAVIQFVNYVESKQIKALLGFTFFSIAAALTKNVLAGLIVPGLLVYLLMTKNFLNIIKDGKFWLAILAILGAYVGLIYYYNSQFPGFVSRMWGYELYGRYTSTIENHFHGHWNYLVSLCKKDFVPYLYLIPIVAAFSFYKKIDITYRNSILCFSSVFVFYLFVISLSKTQTIWYIVPLYLIGSYIIAVGIDMLFNYLKSKKTPSFIWATRVIMLLVWACLFGIIMNKMINKTHPNKDEKYGFFIKDLIAKENKPLDITIIDTDFGTSAMFYKEMYNHNYPQNQLSYQRNADFEIGELVMTCLYRDQNNIAEKYETTVVTTFDECKLLKIISIK